MEASYDLEAFLKATQWVIGPASAIKILPILVLYRNEKTGVEVSVLVGLMNFVYFVFIGGFSDPYTGVSARNIDNFLWYLPILFLADGLLLFTWRRRYMAEKSIF